MINQIQFNLDSCSSEEIKDELCDRMIKIRDGIQAFDITSIIK